MNVLCNEAVPGLSLYTNFWRGKKKTVTAARMGEIKNANVYCLNCEAGYCLEDLGLDGGTILNRSDPTLKQSNSVRVITYEFFKIVCNIDLSSTCISSKWSRPIEFQNQNILFSFYVCCLDSPYLSSLS